MEFRSVLFQSAYQRHDVFNLYGRDLHGSYRFGSLEDFATGNYNRYDVRTPAPGYGVDDIAAALVYTQVSPFLQDTWQVNDQLSLTYGVRVNIPKADKPPESAPGFEEAFRSEEHTSEIQSPMRTSYA